MHDPRDCNVQQILSLFLRTPRASRDCMPVPGSVHDLTPDFCGPHLRAVTYGDQRVPDWSRPHLMLRPRQVADDHEGLRARQREMS